MVAPFLEHQPHPQLGQVFGSRSYFFDRAHCVRMGAALAGTQPGREHQVGVPGPPEDPWAPRLLHQAAGP